VFTVIIVILICVIYYYWVRAKAQSVRKLVDLEVERQRIEGVPVRAISHREYATIVNRADRGGSQHEIETMAHYLLQQDPRERGLNDPQTIAMQPSTIKDKPARFAGGNYTLSWSYSQSRDQYIVLVTKRETVLNKVISQRNFASELDALAEYQNWKYAITEILTTEHSCSLWQNVSFKSAP